MNRTSWRLLLTIGALVAAIAVVAACGDDDGDSKTPAASASADANRGEQLFRANLAGEPGTLDPSKASIATELTVVDNVFRGPFKFDTNLKLVADMAEDVPSKANKGISEDGLTYTFKLKQGLLWSDGKPITAQDVAYGMRRAADPRTGGDYASFFWEIKGGSKLATLKPTDAGVADAVKALGIETPDDRTVRVTLDAPNGVFINYLGLWITYPLREDIITAKGDRWTEPGNLVSSGPYLLKEWEHKDHITLVPNPNYHGEKAVATVRLAMIEDVNQAFNAYKAGQLDEVTVPAALVPTVKGDAKLSKEALSIERLATFRLSPDNRKAPFDNKNVRLAFAYAVDRKALVDVALNGVGKPATSFIPPGMPGYDATLQPGFDAQKAKQLLQQAGFPNGQGLPKVTLTYANTGNNPPVATNLKEQWKQVLGVDVELDPVDSKTFQDRFKAGEISLSFVAWGADYPDAESFLVSNLKTGAGNNKSHFSNKAFDDLLSKAQVETDREKALALYKDAQKLMQDESPDIFLFYFQQYILRSPTVKGLTNTPMDYAVLGDRTFEKVRIGK